MAEVVVEVVVEVGRLLSHDVSLVFLCPGVIT